MPKAYIMGEDENKSNRSIELCRRVVTTESFIAEAKEIYGDRYDYSKVEYKNRDHMVTIVCPVHGDFRVYAREHLDGKGCPKCEKGKKFLAKLKEKFGDKFGLDEFVYESSTSPVTLICPTHGTFSKLPYGILNSKCGCPECGNDFLRQLNEQARQDAIEHKEERNEARRERQRARNEAKRLAEEEEAKQKWNTRIQKILSVNEDKIDVDLPNESWQDDFLGFNLNSFRIDKNSPMLSGRIHEVFRLPHYPLNEIKADIQQGVLMQATFYTNKMDETCLYEFLLVIEYILSRGFINSIEQIKEKYQSVIEYDFSVDGKRDNYKFNFKYQGGYGKLKLRKTNKEYVNRYPVNSDSNTHRNNGSTIVEENASLTDKEIDDILDDIFGPEDNTKSDNLVINNGKIDLFAEFNSKNKVKMAGSLNQQCLPKSFVGIDFETLYPQRVSACSVGMVKYIDGIIVDRYYSLIRPPFDYPGKCGKVLTWVHGLTVEMVKDAKTFKELLPEIETFVDGLPLVAHNACVEKACIRDASAFYGVDTQLDFENIFDTLLLSKKAEAKLGIYEEGPGTHQLDAVCKRFGITAINHHNALADAEMTGNLMVVFQKILCEDKYTEVESTPIVSNKKYNPEDKIQRTDLDCVADNPFKNQVVVLTGFAKADSQEYAHKLNELGAIIKDGVNKKTNILITGYNAGPSKMQKAQDLGVRIMSEEEFKEIINKL